MQIRITSGPPAAAEAGAGKVGTLEGTDVGTIEGKFELESPVKRRAALPRAAWMIVSLVLAIIAVLIAVTVTGWLNV